MERGEGSMRVLSYCVEDTKGKGHKDHAVNNDDLLLVLIPVPDEMTMERLMDLEQGS